jgi:hypothetical protein
MTDIGNRASRRRAGYAWLAAGPVAAAGALAMFMAVQPAVAATAPVNLGTTVSFGVLGGQTVTNTGASHIRGNVGVSPGTAVTGFPPGIVTNGTVHSNDAVAAQAQTDLTTAYNDAAGRTPSDTNNYSVIGAGQTLAPGVYNATSSMDVGGALTLNAGGDPNAVWIFQAGSTLTTDSASSVILTNGAQACNVFWQVGSSATLGTNSTFVGNILALTSITVQTGDTVHGRALARNGSVTLDDDTITASRCATTPTPTPTATSPTPTPTRTRPVPTPTATSPTPTPTRTRPVPTPTRTRPGPTPTRTRPGPTPTRTRPVPSPTATGPKPSPTATGPKPSPTAIGPKPTPTGTRPAPAPTSTSPGPRPPMPAPAPAPVGATFPVTG